MEDTIQIKSFRIQNKMRIIADTTEFHIAEKTAVAIGKFDGLHIGHQALLKEIIKAKEEGLLATVFTFNPSPSVFFSGGKEKVLTPIHEKRKMFEALGVDILYEYPLNEMTASILPEDFIRDFLVEKLNASRIVCGPDLSFGKGGKGNYDLLSSMASRGGYTVSCIQKIFAFGEEVSSSLVRRLVSQGEFEKVEKLLGFPYSFSGTIVPGKQLGSKLGMATANLIPVEDKLLPPFGVYFAKALLDGKEFSGIFNVGCKPTVNDTSSVNIEMHIYGLEGEQYGKELTIFCKKFRRAEMKFSSVDELKKQMSLDLQAGREYFGIALQ